MTLPAPTSPVADAPPTPMLARNISPAGTGCTTTSADGVEHPASKPSCEMASEGAGGVIDNTSTSPHATSSPPNPMPTPKLGIRPAATPVAD